MRNLYVNEMKTKVANFVKTSIYLHGCGMVLMLTLFLLFPHTYKWPCLVFALGIFIYSTFIATQYSMLKKQLRETAYEGKMAILKELAENFLVVYIRFTLWAPLIGMFWFVKS